MMNLLIKIFIWVIVGLVVSFFIISMIQIFRPEETIYCSFENTIDKGVLPRTECGSMKIISKDIDMINFESLLSANVTNIICSEDYSDVFECDSENRYYADYQLRLFCDDCGVDGVICINYAIEYLNMSHPDAGIAKEIYESMFSGKNLTKEEARLLMDQCKRRK